MNNERSEMETHKKIFVKLQKEKNFMMHERLVNIDRGELIDVVFIACCLP